MANWLERARHEIPRSAGQGTAKTDERDLSTVTSVCRPDESEKSSTSIGSNGSAPAAILPEIEVASGVTADEEAAIRSWLAQIDETDEAVITHVLNRCRQDLDVRHHFIRLASSEAPRRDPFPDDRRRCDLCTNLTGRGLCLAARRGEVAANQDYEPVRDLLRRCEGYMPGVDDADRRTGRERWPGLIQKGNE
jgi:hypothetical protein